MKKIFFVTILSVSILGCDLIPSPNLLPEPNESEKLKVIVRSYFEDTLILNPLWGTFVGRNQLNSKFNEPLGIESIEKQQLHVKKYLNQLKSIKHSSLVGQDLLNYQILKYSLEHEKKGFDFRSDFMPIDQFGGVHNFFVSLGSGQSAQPFNTVTDYENFLLRAKGFASYMDSAVTAMKDGVEAGIVLPKVLVEKVLPQLAYQIVDKPTESTFYGPVEALKKNDAISESDKARLSQAYIETISQVIVPAYEKVHKYMSSEYLGAARDTVGLSELPNGKLWYEYMIQTNTTLPLSAESLHKFGLSEVQRILDEMTNVKERVKFQGTLDEFFNYLRNDQKFFFSSEQEVINAYTKVKIDIDSKIPALFSVFPKADYVVKPVESFRAASAAGASYMPPSLDGTRPGIFYINTHNLKAQPKYLVETLSVHEAAPGHHFQIAIQQEVDSLPLFRKFGGYTVFAEGWALYAESLGKEMGLFTDPYMWYGRLSDEQLRAMRLVVDTGLHAFGWSRQRAIDYMLANSSMAKSDVIAEVERYIAMPGQALAYKTGERHIRQLREYVASELEDSFDVKVFHEQILTDGAMPMPILTNKIETWIKQIN